MHDEETLAEERNAGETPCINDEKGTRAVAVGLPGFVVKTIDPHHYKHWNRGCVAVVIDGAGQELSSWNMWCLTIPPAMATLYEKHIMMSLSPLGETNTPKPTQRTKLI